MVSSIRNLTSIRVQCGGSEYNGTTCCQTGYSCVIVNDYYYQCQPSTAVCILTAISPQFKADSFQTAVSSSTGSASLAAATFSGATDYTTHLATTTATSTHTQAAYPAATAGSCGAWTLVENVCCPSYCGSDNTSESCSTAANCNCTTPPAAMCKSGTMYPEVHSVSSSEAWHYSVSGLPQKSGLLTHFCSVRHISASRAAVLVASVSTVCARKEAQPPAGRMPG